MTERSGWDLVCGAGRGEPLEKGDAPKLVGAAQLFVGTGWGRVLPLGWSASG